MDRPESATKMPEAGKRISPARYCTSTRRPRNAEERAILYSVSETSSNRVNSTEAPPTENCGKAGLTLYCKEASQLRAAPRKRADSVAERNATKQILDFSTGNAIVGVPACEQARWRRRCSSY